jgi:hypothetical protein
MKRRVKIAHAESFNKRDWTSPPLPSNLKNHPDLSGFHNFAFYLFTFFPKLENTKAIDKSLNWQLRLPRQNALVCFFDAAEFERVAVKMTFELLLLPPVRKCTYLLRPGPA